MQTSAVGRNDPCPCGSGRKFKKCCLEKRQFAPSGGPAAEASADLRQAMAGMQFTSRSEVQAFVERHTQQRNHSPLMKFQGLSPEQMRCMLHLPFASPQVVDFPQVLDTIPAAAVVSLLELLIEAIGETGLKPTAKGNLPRKFCREAALRYWGEEVYRENTRVTGINGEEDFFDLHVTRLVAELAGLIRKYKGRFILSRDCRALLTGKGSSALYPRMFRAYVERFNWGYCDRYAELRFVQGAFLFTLYLLTRYGDAWRPHAFYEDSFLRAFPMLLDEIPPNQVFPPEEHLRSCYTSRTLVRFIGFFGLAAVEPVFDESGKRLFQEYRVKGLPLLHETVQFHMAG